MSNRKNSDNDRVGDDAADDVSIDNSDDKVSCSRVAVVVVGSVGVVHSKRRGSFGSCCGVTTFDCSGLVLAVDDGLSDATRAPYSVVSSVMVLGESEVNVVVVVGDKIVVFSSSSSIAA